MSSNTLKHKKSKILKRNVWHFSGPENIEDGIKAAASRAYGTGMPDPDSPGGMGSAIILAYRPLWIVLNLFLIITAFVDWGNSNTSTIKVDLPNIKAQTAKIVKNDSVAQKLSTDFGFKTRDAPGQDFCTWAASTAVKSKLKDPFNKLDCSDKESLKLKDFQAYNMHTFSGAANTTVWHIYAYGEQGQDGELFATGTDIKEPSKSIINDYIDNNGIYTGPHKCATKYLKWSENLTIAFGSAMIVYLIAHIAHWAADASGLEARTMQMFDILVLALSVFVYIFAIVVFFVHTNSKLFTECSWISTWFQTNYYTLFMNNYVYVICGFIGLVFCLVHVFAVRRGIKPDLMYMNLVVGNNLLPE